MYDTACALLTLETVHLVSIWIASARTCQTKWMHLLPATWEQDWRNFDILLTVHLNIFIS